MIAIAATSVAVSSSPSDQAQAGRMPPGPVRISNDAALLLFAVILAGRVIAFSGRHAE